MKVQVEGDQSKSVLTQLALLVNGDLGRINAIVGNRSGDPMRAACADLAVSRLPGAHWLPLECKADLVQAIRRRLRDKAL